MKDKDRRSSEKIENDHRIKPGDDFSWGGNTLQWEEQSLDVASRYKSYKGEKKYRPK